MKTKKLFFLSLAGLILPFLSIAQTNTYRSYFGNEFTHWYTFYNYFDVVFSEMCSVEGDTILSNGINYKKLCNVYDSIYYCMGIREEAETGSLFINTDGDSEILVSRMDLETGDKFYFTPFANDYDYHFENLQTDENGSYTIVDSIYYEDNRKHIRFEAVYHAYINYTQLTFIEGVGPNISFDPFYKDWWAICFNCYETESVLMKIKFPLFHEEEDCLFNRMGNKKINLDFPLKFIRRKGEIELQAINGFESGQVYLYSIQGELMYSRGVKGEANIVIPVSGFSKGTYLIIFQEEKTKRIWRSKYLKHEK